MKRRIAADKGVVRPQPAEPAPAAAWRLRLRKLRARTSPGGDGRAELAGVIADLSDLNQKTENDFLVIARKLSGFEKAVKLMASKLTALAEALAGECGPRASQGLGLVLERSKAMNARAAESIDLLGDMHRRAARLRKTLAGFDSTWSAFHSIGVLTRVETARLGAAGADFGSLTDGVKRLADSIQDKIEGALATASQLLPAIEKALREVSDRESGLAADLPGVIAEVLDKLAVFRGVQDRMREASARLAGRYAAISEAFGDLIVSIQGHDITRQQVEHVIEALRQAGTPGAAVLGLQAMQLAAAANQFAASAAAIERSLDQIAGHVVEIAGEGRKLCGISNDERDSFLLELERACTVVLSSLSGCADSEAATRAAGAELLETVARMRASVAEIQTVEIEVQRMALNANIRAAHLGGAGEALGVLADAMQKLGSESAGRSASLVEMLDGAGEATGRLSQPGASADASLSDALDGLRRAVADLHTMSKRGFAEVAQIAARGAALGEDLAAARQGFCVGGMFAETIGRARETLQRLAGASQPSGDSPHLEQQLATFEKFYTMRSERDVHQDLTHAAEETAAGLADDGVELF